MSLFDINSQARPGTVMLLSGHIPSADPVALDPATDHYFSQLS